MKTLLFLLLTIVAASSFAQTIVEYRYVNNKLYGVDSTGNFIKLPHIKYGKNEPLPDPVVNYKMPENFTPEKLIETPANHAKDINKAGKLFITSGVLIIAGSIVSAVGITTETPAISYVGAGISAISVFTTIAAGVQLMHFKFPKSDLNVSAGKIKVTF